RILTDQPFRFPPELLRKLSADRWVHWGNERAANGDGYPVYERVLKVQRVALDELLDPRTLARLQNGALKAGPDEKPVTIAEVFRVLSDGIWTDLPNGDEKRPASSVIRRNLQREYVKELSKLVLGSRSGGSRDLMALLLGLSSGGPAPADARSLARLHPRDAAARIGQALAMARPALDDTVRAHLEECKERIAKVLSAAMQVND